MDKDLVRLLMTRYWKLLIAITLIVVGSSLVSTTASITQWNNQYKIAFGPEEKRKDTNFEPDEVGKYYMIHYHGPNKDNSTTDYQFYRKHQLTFFVEDFGRNYFGTYFSYDGSLYYNEFSSFLIFISILVGFSLFFYDLKTNFNTLLFSNRFSKKQLYWHKQLLIGGTLFLSLLVGKLLTVTSLWLAIPPDYLNSSLLALISSGLFVTVLMLSFYAISSLIGLLLGEWISAILTLIGFWWTFFLFSDALTDLLNTAYAYLTGQNLRNTFIHNPINTFVFELTSRTVPLTTFLVLIVTIVISLVIGVHWFQKTSLEENGHYLLFTSLRRPILWCFIIYCNITLNFRLWTYPIYEEDPLNINYLLSRLIIITLIAYLIGQLVIYRKLPLKRKHKEKKLAPL